MDHNPLQLELSLLKQPIIIGIAGDSGSGKTRFSKGIRQLLGSEHVFTIEMDGYHKENREERKKSSRLPLDPEMNKLELVLEHLKQLKQGNQVELPIYNHDTGNFDQPISFSPTPIIILEGLFALYPEFLPYLDFTIYVDPSRDVKWRWKKNRDLADRGHNEQSLEEEMLKREAAYKRWIDFQKTNATIVIKIFQSQIKHLARYEFIGSLKEDCYKYELLVEPSHSPLPSLFLPFDLAMITDIHTPPFMLASAPGKYWGRNILTIHIDGELASGTVSSLAHHIEESTGKSLEFDSKLDQISTTRFTQLLITWRFLELVTQKIKEHR